MLNKKYKSSSLVIKGSNHKEFPSGDARKSRKRDVRGMTTHGADIVNGKIVVKSQNGLQAIEAKSRAGNRGVGTNNLSPSDKEKMAKGIAKTHPERKVDNSAIKITMGAPKETNVRKEVSGVYMNNKLHTINSNFKRKK